METEEKRNEVVIDNIINNYRELEKSIVAQLNFDVSNHPLTAGTFREDIWKSLFQQIIPKKFAIERGVFIIDSNGMVSKEVDLAIFDEQYTPYIFNYGQIRFIPIEAVAVVVQCKSGTVHNEKLKEWTDSIDKLKTNINSIARMHGYIVNNELDINSKDQTQTATKPIKILCYLKEESTRSVREGLFDIKLAANPAKHKLEAEMSERDLKKWYLQLNHAQNYSRIDKGGKLENKSISDLAITKDNEENTLLSLIFQLNQLLMLINNPLLFPHKAYVKMFNGHLKNE